MTDEEKRLLKTELEKAGSIPALLKKMADSQSEEFRLLRRQTEEGPDHPSGEVLYDYVLGWMDRDFTARILDHLILCRKCLEEVIRIRNIEETLTTDTLNRADKVSLYSRITEFISNLSFPVSLEFPALEAERSTASDEESGSFAPGDELMVTLEAPADGYVAIFHGCEETGQVKLVFPLYATDNPRVSAGQEMPPIEQTVERPPGKHWFKVFWTRGKVFDPEALRPDDEAVLEEVVEGFLDAIESLPSEDWRCATEEYEVVAD